jgi:hypothetical protein
MQYHFFIENTKLCYIIYYPNSKNTSYLGIILVFSCSIFIFSVRRSYKRRHFETNLLGGNDHVIFRISLSNKKT